MRTDLLTIVSALLNNINASCDPDDFRTNLEGFKFLAMRTIVAIENIRDKWPKITQDEVQELNIIVESLKTIYDYTHNDIYKDHLGVKAFPSEEVQKVQ